MKLPQIPQDDLMDVMEMMNKMEESINGIMKGNSKNLAISALMSASINCLLENCDYLHEAVFYRKLFIETLNNAIREIKISEKEEPSQAEE